MMYESLLANPKDTTMHKIRSIIIWIKRLKVYYLKAYIVFEFW